MASAPEDVGDIRIVSRQSVFRKQECERRDLQAEKGPGCWLLRLPKEASAQMFGGRKHKGAAVLKVGTRRDGKTGLTIRVRNHPEGLKPEKYCQRCGLGAANCSCGGGAAPALPWSSYAVPPYCEYCGGKARLPPHGRACSSCGTVELEMRSSSSGSQNPQKTGLVVRRVSQDPATGEVSSSYSLNVSRVDPVFDVVAPPPPPLQPAVLLHSTWKCPACGLSSPGACSVSGELHDVPVIPAEVGIDDSAEAFLKTDEALGLQFNKKPAAQIKNSIVRAMLREPGKKWRLPQIADATLEPMSLVRRFIGELAVRDQNGYFTLKPTVKPNFT